MSNNPQLDEFIQSSRAAGQTDESIKVDLIQAGWDLPSIEDALAPSIVPTNSPVELTPASNSHNQFKKYRKPVAAVLVLVLLGLGGCPGKYDGCQNRQIQSRSFVYRYGP